jgi:hypothetical protein
MKVLYPGPAVDPAVAVTRQVSLKFGVTLEAGQDLAGNVVPVEIEVSDESAATGLASGLFAPLAEVAPPVLATDPGPEPGRRRRREEPTPPAVEPTGATE